MEIPKYIVFRVDVMKKGTSVELTNITDDVEDVILKAEQTEPNSNADQHVQHVEYVGDDELKRCRECKYCVGEYHTPISANGSYYTYITCTANGCNYEQTEPQTMYYPQVDGITPSVIEPQTDCSWK